MSLVSVTPKEMPPPRLYFILARNAPVGVIFRRGPTQWVQIIKWNTETDQFEFGQWFHGRIYEERSDISPDGTKMIYFARKKNAKTLADTEYTYAWTAISKPPYLTALVLWPKGDCWHGGGLFNTNSSVWLNHRPERAQPHPAHKPPRSLTVIPNPHAYGEDGPVISRRLERDGWIQDQEWRGRVSGGYETTQPDIFHKDHPTRPLKLVWTSAITGFAMQYSFKVESAGGRSAELENAEWADWDQRGRLCYVGKGKLFAASVQDDCTMSAKELADFSDRKPEGMQAPAWARRW